MLKIIRNDGIRVVRTVRVDMIDSFFQRIDDFNRKNRSVVFLRPIIFGASFTRPKFSKMALEAGSQRSSTPFLK